jgi:serine/threonine protein kinase
MGLPVGTRLGTYEIVGSLGAGGMGEVYRAKDAKLKREIAHIHGLEEAPPASSAHAPFLALVMELVEGENLAQNSPTITSPAMTMRGMILGDRQPFPDLTTNGAERYAVFSPRRPMDCLLHG